MDEQVNAGIQEAASAAEAPTNSSEPTQQVGQDTGQVQSEQVNAPVNKEPTNHEEAWQQLNRDLDATSGNTDGHTEEPQNDTRASDKVDSTPEPDEPKQPDRPTDNEPQFDERAHYEKYQQGCFNEASKEVDAFMQQKNFREMDISELMREEEVTLNSGEKGKRVLFINPDTGEEFSREQARNWIKGQHEDYQGLKKRLTIQAARQKYDAIKPAADALAFKATRYRQMDSDAREVFDQLIDPYKVVNAAGNPISFKCNLDLMADQAEAIVGRFRTGHSEIAREQSNAPVTQPVTDMKSASSDPEGVTDDKEPTTHEEAWAQFNRDQERKEKQNG